METYGVLQKQQDTQISSLEKENFDLKLQINHLRQQLKDFTNQTSVSFFPHPCSCQEKQQETQDILQEVKSTMEALIREKAETEHLLATAQSQIVSLEEEKEDLKRDCIKLSQHISHITQREKDKEEMLEKMREEMPRIKTELENAQELRHLLDAQIQNYNMLKEEYVRLEDFSKSVEAEYKSALSKITALEQQHVAASRKSGEALATARRHAEDLESRCRVAEQAILELKKEKQSLHEKSRSVEHHADKVLREKQQQVHVLQNALQKNRTLHARLDAFLSTAESRLVSHINKIECLDRRVDALPMSVLSAREIANTLVHSERQRSREEIQQISRHMQKARAEKEAAEENCRKKEAEYAEISSRLEITQETAELAARLGIHEFTSLRALFNRFAEHTLQLEREHRKALEEKDRRQKEEEAFRSRKLEEFQSQLQAALSEVSACRTYLEEKKRLIKMLRGAKSSLIGRIDVAAANK